MVSEPLSAPWAVTGRAFSFLMARWRRGRRHSRTSVLLPEPLTPVTNTKRPNGNLTVIRFKLFTAAPLKSRDGCNAEAGLDPRPRRRRSRGAAIRFAFAREGAGAKSCNSRALAVAVKAERKPLRSTG